MTRLMAMQRTGPVIATTQELRQFRIYVENRGNSRGTPPSIRQRVANWPSQMRTAFSSIDWNTGSSSPGELEMTFNTSEVAVCCSSDSERSSVRWRSSLSSRVFSMAITACAAKFCDQLDLLVGERADLLAVNADGADQLVVLEHRHDKQRFARRRARQRTSADRVRCTARHVGDVDDLLRLHDATETACSGLGRVADRAAQLFVARAACCARDGNGTSPFS